MSKTIYELIEGLKILQKYDPDAQIIAPDCKKIQVKISCSYPVSKNDESSLAKLRWACYENIWWLKL